MDLGRRAGVLSSHDDITCTELLRSCLCVLTATSWPRRHVVISRHDLLCFISEDALVSGVSSSDDVVISRHDLLWFI